VALEIYDLQGRLVRRIARGDLSAGSYAAEWNRRDAAGHAVPGGVYFVRLAADHAGREEATTRKIIVIE
jgi:flagellar hook assembly protein FlgD